MMTEGNLRLFKDVEGAGTFFAIVGTQVLIFMFDIFTREDDVSIGFLYTLPTLMGFFVKDRRLLIIIVSMSCLLIAVGSVILIAPHENTLVFIANRILSAATVLITGFMIHYRVKLERTLGEALVRERNASATQRAFVSMVSHEFRTPLTIIDAEAYRLVKIKDTIEPDDIERRAKSIRGSVTRMVKLIDGVLCSARALENRINFRPEAVNLHNLINTVCKEREKESSAAIEFIDKGLPNQIRADHNLLFYVFDNLIGNAIKYSPQHPTVKVLASVEAGWVLIEVWDEGIGVPPEDLPRLFDMYFRSSNVGAFPGSGVGLYIVRTFVQLHGGRVGVESVLGQGSVFTVHLPIAAAAQGG